MKGGVLYAATDSGPGRERKDHPGAPAAVPGRAGQAPNPDGARAAVPRGGAGPVPLRGGRRLPLRRGALLQPSQQPGVPGGGGHGGARAGRGGPHFDDAPGGAVRGQPAHRVRPPLPPTRLSGGAAVHSGRAEKLLRPARAPAPGGGGGRSGGGGQAARPGAYLHRLRGPVRPHRPGPQGPAHPDGGEAKGLPLGPGGRPVAGRIYRLYPPAAGGAAGAAETGGHGHRHPHLRPSGGGRRGGGDFLTRPAHRRPAAPSGQTGANSM